MKYLCILDIKLLLVTSFANIFSHSVGCLFILSMVSFALQKLLNSIRSHFKKFLLLSPLCQETDPKKLLLWLMSKSILPMFSSRNFIVSSLKFRSWIHLGFIFVYGLKNMHWVNRISEFFFCPEEKSSAKLLSRSGIGDEFWRIIMWLSCSIRGF